MNATPREHYEEIDWLDFVQGSADRSQAGEMHHHLARCEACRGRLDSMRFFLPLPMHRVLDDGLYSVFELPPRTGVESLWACFLRPRTRSCT